MGLRGFIPLFFDTLFFLPYNDLFNPAHLCRHVGEGAPEASEDLVGSRKTVEIDHGIMHAFDAVPVKNPVLVGDDAVTEMLPDQVFFPAFVSGQEEFHVRVGSNFCLHSTDEGFGSALTNGGYIVGTADVDADHMGSKAVGEGIDLCLDLLGRSEQVIILGGIKLFPGKNIHGVGQLPVEIFVQGHAGRVISNVLIVEPLLRGELQE